MKLLALENNEQMLMHNRDFCDSIFLSIKITLAIDKKII
jgi:hypothetical protein